MENKVLVFENEEDFRKMLKLNPEINGVSVDFYEKIFKREENFLSCCSSVWGNSNRGCWNCVDCNWCLNCTNCVNCDWCINCTNCDNCKECIFNKADTASCDLKDKVGLLSARR